MKADQPLLELSKEGCRWPVEGVGATTMFCNNPRNNSGHPSYCRFHHARALRINEAPTIPVTYRRPVLVPQPF